MELLEDKKIRILVVDDEEGIRSALSQWFDLRGFLVDQAGDGLQAVEKCAQNDFDVITMDLEMPLLNGFGAISRIRKIQPGVPILALTGYTKLSEEALNSGADAVVLKPIPLRDLEKHVMELVGKKE
jgi:CheY-like chemotaxis protein